MILARGQPRSRHHLANDLEISSRRDVRLVTGVRRQDTTDSDVERSESREREAVTDAHRDWAIPDLSGLASGGLARLVVGILPLKVPVRSKVGADPSAKPEHLIQGQRIVELGVLPKAANQQRARLLRSGRSAEEQGRHCTDGPTSS